MKNLIFFSFLISLLLVFPGCSKDDDGEDKKTSNSRLNLHYDTGNDKFISAYLYIYDLENNYIQNFELFYEKRNLYYLKDINGNKVFPVVKMLIEESTGFIYYDALPPHLYRKDACKVLLIPKLLNKPYSYTCKIVEWKKFGENLIFEKTFKSNPEKEDEYEVW